MQAKEEKQCCWHKGTKFVKIHSQSQVRGGAYTAQILRDLEIRKLGHSEIRYQDIAPYTAFLRIRLKTKAYLS
jgi:hypothetical protein